jgi:hypothetical protein
MKSAKIRLIRKIRVPFPPAFHSRQTSRSGPPGMGAGTNAKNDATLHGIEKILGVFFGYSEQL